MERRHDSVRAQRLHQHGGSPADQGPRDELVRLHIGGKSQQVDIVLTEFQRCLRGTCVPVYVVVRYDRRPRAPGRAGKSPRGPRLALRNRYLMAIKNDAGVHLLKDLPRILMAEIP